MGQKTKNHRKNDGATKQRKGRRRSKIDGESNRADGGFSEIPEAVKHRILSFLPVHDAIRASLLSTAWEDAWFSTPFLEFDLSFVFCKKKEIKFMSDCVDYILESREIDAGITRFSLKMPEGTRWDHSDFESWLSFATSKNVKELCLEAEGEWFTLPPTFFNFRSLTELKLHNCDLFEIPISICLTRLKKMSLILLWIYDDCFDTLLAACPSLETLIVKFCRYISSIQISSPTLKFVELFHRHSMNIDIKADHLHSFSYYHEDCAEDCSECAEDCSDCTEDCSDHTEPLSVQIEIGFCQALKILSLENVPITDDEVKQLVCHLPLLERLVLIGCETLKHICISSLSLKSIFFVRSDSTEEVYFNTPNLLRLTYHGMIFSSFFMNCPNILEAKIKLKDSREKCDVDLICFLSLFGHAKVLKLTCSVEALLFPKELRADFSPLKEIKHLDLNMIESTSSKSKLIGSLLWFFPSLETLSVNLEFIEKHFKFLTNVGQGKRDGSSYLINPPSLLAILEEEKL